MLKSEILNKCCDEYSKQLESSCPQVRGRKFEILLQKILQGHNIESDIRIIKEQQNGEIDLYFCIEHERFLISLKWEKDPIDDNAVTQLYGRLKARKASFTVGIVLSMSGFTDLAVNTAKSLGIVLLDKTFFEALLVGFVGCKELFTEMILPYITKYVEYKPNLLEIMAENARSKRINILGQTEIGLKLEDSRDFEKTIPIPSDLGLQDLCKDDSNIFLCNDFGIGRFNLSNLTLNFDHEITRITSVCKTSDDLTLVARRNGVMSHIKDQNEVRFIRKSFPGNINLRIINHEDPEVCYVFYCGNPEPEGTTNHPGIVKVNIESLDIQTDQTIQELSGGYSTPFLPFENYFVALQNSSDITKFSYKGNLEKKFALSNLSITNPCQILEHKNSIYITQGDGKIIQLDKEMSIVKNTYQVKGQHPKLASIDNKLYAFYTSHQ